MNKEIQALDLAISKLQEEKEKAIKKATEQKKDTEKKANQKISPKDKLLIKKLNERAEWWKKSGPPVEKTIKITIKANLIWTEGITPYVDGYNVFYQGKELDLDELIRTSLFSKHLEIAQKEINKICDQANKLEEKYPDAAIEIFT